MDGIDLAVIGKLILNIILVSIPEEIFFVAFALMIQKRYDLLKPTRKNVLRFFVPVLSLAFLSNVLRTFLEVTVDFMPIIAIFILFISTALVYNMRNTKQLLKVFASYILSYLVVSIIQLSYIPLLLNATGIDANELNNYGLLLVLISLPERVIECCILAYLMSKRASLIKINIFKEVLRNKTISIVTISVFILNVVFVTLMGKLVFFNHILSELRIVAQFVAIEGVLIFPILNIAMLFAIIYNMTAKEKFERMLSKERIETLVSILEMYASNQNYGKVNAVINDINKHLEELYQHKN